MSITVPTEGRPAKRPMAALVGEDGNAFAIIRRVTAALRRAGASRSFVESYQKESMSGDYNHLLATAVSYIEACDDEDTTLDYLFGLTGEDL
jgi:hypothetical protein